MYCPTCLRNTFKMTYTEGLVIVVSFDYATRVESVELVQEDKMFEEWRCAYCGGEVHLQNSIMALDSKVEKWVKEQGLCCSINRLSDHTHLMNE